MDAGVQFRPTFGTAIPSPWRAAGVSMDCEMGSGTSNRWDFHLHMTDGRTILIDLTDIVGAPANQAQFWQHVDDDHVPVALDAFHRDDPGCRRDFPGLRRPA